MSLFRKPRAPDDDLPELCHSLMERAPAPMAELEGIEHILRYVNPAFCRLVGKDRTALIGRSFAETAQDGDCCLSVLDRVYHTAEPETYTEVEGAESHPLYWSYAVWPVVGVDQQPVGVMMQVTETTRFHQQTAAMNQELLRSAVRHHELTEVAEKLNDELERRVSDRTQELEQSQGRLRALATELNLAEQRERKRLATDLHDYLAQLLVLGRMMLGQAKRSGLPTRGEDFVKEAEEALDKALTYCRTLMAELKPPVLQERGFSAGLIWLGDHMKRQELTVSIDIPEAFDLPLPEDRAVLLFQSVRELLINVAKHGTVKQASVRMTYENGLLKIIVQDENGFDLAAATTTTTTTTSDNTSLLSSKFGLFSIRERMKALGGDFEIQSAPGEGTTATLSLPVGTRTEDSGLKTESSEKPVGRQPSLISSPSDRSVLSTQSSALQKNAPIRVLLVDDHAVLRQGLRSIVAAYAQLEVVGEAGDGIEAVTLTQQLGPDVVVMDINMPNMDGIEATRRIKENRPDTIVIALSVNQSADTERKMRAAGAFTYLRKESAADALRQAIEEAMASKQETAAHNTAPD
ncbi:MAG TPA: response regulator [Nitrospira sp.]|nr:response regulator [Nitrospira sp.]